VYNFYPVGLLIIEHVMCWAAALKTGVRHKMLLFEENVHFIKIGCCLKCCSQKYCQSTWHFCVKLRYKTQYYEWTAACIQ